MEEKSKCLKCGIELFYKPKNKLSISMCIECYYDFKNKPKIKTEDYFGTVPMDDMSDEEFNKALKEL